MTRRRNEIRGSGTAKVVGGVVAGVLLAALLYRLREPASPNFRVPHGFGVSAPTFVPSDLLVPALTPGNRVEFLENGDAIFPSMLAAIRSAEKTITFEAYIFWSGRVGAESGVTFPDDTTEPVRCHIAPTAPASW